MFLVILINKDEADLGLKWPLEERIMFTLHENKEDGEVCFFSNTITIEVSSDTHLITISPCVKWWGVNASDKSSSSISDSLTNFRYTPQECSIVSTSKRSL